ncbi:MAG TPA: hypothetical protein VNT79_12240 [Phycisphaerae bacterium]|nr:hypothetical protein [Phycisphaerae bacterium]
MIATSADRVTENTDPKVNEQIRINTDANITFYSEHPHLISRRLRELDEEWDVERVLETGSSALSLFGLGMSILRSRKWLILPLAVQSFFLQHALQGWCPPLPVIRRLGFRTAQEIDFERCTLKAKLHNEYGNEQEGNFEDEGEDMSDSRSTQSSATGPMNEPQPEIAP